MTLLLPNGSKIADHVLLRTDDLLIVNKPSGIAVHASGRTDTHLGLYWDQLRFERLESPELAHRLDRETSGCLLLGRHKAALKKLGALFAHGRVRKTYWAVVVGQTPGESGVIDAPLAKQEAKYGWRMKVDPKNGQPSVTEWRRLGQTSRLTWIECHPRTGRTHQLRVHLASIGLPIVGDSVYGQGTADMVADRLHLHARSLAFRMHPRQDDITATAPPPEHMLALLTECGWGTEGHRHEP